MPVLCTFSQYLLTYPESIMKTLNYLGNSNYKFAKVGLQPPAESSSTTSRILLSTVPSNKLPSKSQQVKSKSHFLTSKASTVKCS